MHQVQELEYGQAGLRTSESKLTFDKMPRIAKESSQEKSRIFDSFPKIAIIHKIFLWSKVVSCNIIDSNNALKQQKRANDFFCIVVSMKLQCGAQQIMQLKIEHNREFGENYFLQAEISVINYIIKSTVSDDQKLSFDEFSRLCNRIPPDTPESLVAAFKTLDKEGKSYLNLYDLK